MTLPTPYYQREGITIYHGDCREILPAIDADSVDLVLTDPPYGERTHAGTRTRTIGADSVPLVDFKSITTEQAIADFRELLRVSKRWVIATCEWRHAAYFEDAGLPLLRLGIWIKPNGIPQLNGDRPGTGWEAVACLHKKGKRSKWNGGGKRGIWTHNRVDATFHPTQKPTALFKDLMMDFSDEGDLIFDPFMGSGTTLEVAKQMGRKAIGIELEECYCEIAVSRLRQKVLF